MTTLVRALVRFFPDKDHEVQLFSVEGDSQQHCYQKVESYFQVVKQTYSQLEVEVIGSAVKLEMEIPGVFKIQ